MAKAEMVSPEVRTINGRSSVQCAKVEDIFKATSRVREMTVYFHIHSIPVTTGAERNVLS